MTFIGRHTKFNQAFMPTLRCWSRASVLLLGLWATWSLYLEPSSISASSATPVPPSYFGLHIHHIGAATPWPEVHFAQWRLWDAYVAWPNLEPHQGQWHFEILDRYVTSAEQHGVDILLPLDFANVGVGAPDEPSTYHPGNALNRETLRIGTLT